MASIDWARFGVDVAAHLKGQSLSFSGAVEAWPGTNKAMLSRAVNAQPIAAASFLLLCRAAELDPYAYLDGHVRPRITMKSILKQAVTANVPHGTSEILS